MWKMAEKMGMPKSAIEAIKAKQKNGDKSAMPDMGKMMSMMQAMKGEKKDEMRKMLTPEFIAHNITCFKKQMSRFIDFGEDKAIIVNNADWLLDLNYVQLLREVGVHFTVNRMLAAECFKKRWEKGLTFFEFNYMIMQGYDFWKLHHDHNCIMELGGDDQWSNMLAGVELIRRKDQKPAYCMTCKLLTTSDGRKMGKTEKGALWLDPEKTSPYDFYQYCAMLQTAT